MSLIVRNSPFSLDSSVLNLNDKVLKRPCHITEARLMAYPSTTFSGKQRLLIVSLFLLGFMPLQPSFATTADATTARPALPTEASAASPANSSTSGSVTGSSTSGLSDKEQIVLQLGQRLQRNMLAVATCQSLLGEAAFRDSLAEQWAKEKAGAIRLLKAQSFSPAFYQQFAAGVLAKPIIDPDMRLREAIPFCDSNKEAVRKYMEFDFHPLDSAIRDALDE
jgi:hypothetical protein